MEKRMTNVLKCVCYVVLVGTILWVAFYAVQTYYVLTTGGGHGVINWDSPRLGFKLTLLLTNRITILLVAGLVGAFVFNILKYLKSGVIFNRTNVVLLWIMTFLLPIHSFVGDNMGIACSTAEHFDVVLTDTPFVYAVLALLVALLYQLAYRAAEEQKLTI